MSAKFRQQLSNESEDITKESLLFKSPIISSVVCYW